MSSLVITITVRDPQLLGYGFTRTMDIRGDSGDVPASALKSISQLMTAQLMADLDTARSQGKKSKDRQLELMPQSADEHRPLNPVDDGITLQESLNDAIAAWLKEDERRTEEEQEAAEIAGKMVQKFRDVLPETDDISMALTSVFTQLQQMTPEDVIREWILFPVKFDDATHAADFCKAMFGVAIDLGSESEDPIEVDPDTGEISGDDDGEA